MENLYLKTSPSRKTAQFFDSDFHKLSHDLRTPLNHINGFAELLLLDEGLSPASADYVRAILEGSATLNTVVVSYLNGSEVEVVLPLTDRADDATYLSETLGSWTPSFTTRKLRPESDIGPLVNG